MIKIHSGTFNYSGLSLVFYFIACLVILSIFFFFKKWWTHIHLPFYRLQICIYSLFSSSIYLLMTFLIVYIATQTQLPFASVLSLSSTLHLSFHLSPIFLISNFSHVSLSVIWLFMYPNPFFYCFSFLRGVVV